jgi:hypothetical protein
VELFIRPDDKQPNGGYANLILTGDVDLQSSATVAVVDAYSERHLGENGWQSEPVVFGPYQIETVDNGFLLTIGPEIVNQLEEYAALKFNIGGLDVVASWPDDVVPAPGAAVIGKLQTGDAVEAKPALRSEMAAPRDEIIEEKPDVSETIDDVVEEPSENAAATDVRSKTTFPIFLLLLLAALIAGTVYWFMTQEQAEPEPAMEPESLAEDQCSNEAFSALSDQGFVAAETLLRDCGERVSADNALIFLEDGAKAGAGTALLSIGKIYDQEAVDDEIEIQIGLTYPDNPAIAAGYYARALAAGASEAETLLEALCQRMSGITDTLTKSAFQDHCNE